MRVGGGEGTDKTRTQTLGHFLKRRGEEWYTMFRLDGKSDRYGIQVGGAEHESLLEENEASNLRVRGGV